MTTTDEWIHKVEVKWAMKYKIYDVLDRIALVMGNIID